MLSTVYIHATRLHKHAELFELLSVISEAREHSICSKQGVAMGNHLAPGSFDLSTPHQPSDGGHNSL